MLKMRDDISNNAFHSLIRERINENLCESIVHLSYRMSRLMLDDIFNQ